MNINLAILSTNRNKFSETFIQTQIKELPYRIVLYTNGYLPTHLSLDKGFHSKKITAGFWQSKEPKELLKKSFKKNKISVVLAQYGQSGVEVMDICQELNIPLLVHFHGFDAYRNDALNSYGKKYPELFEKAKAIVAVSKDMLLQLKKLGCPESKLHFIPYGVDTTLFQASEKNISSDFISIGRFVEKKGHLHCIKAFKLLVEKYPKAQLKLVGDGPLEKEIRAMVKQEVLENNVQFLGILSPQEVSAQLQSSGIYVQHSFQTSENDSEGTPVSILEAMSCGLPIVSTKHGGIVDLIEDSQNGFLVNEKDEIKMFQAMETLFNSPELVKKIAKNNRQIALTKYQKERYLKELSALVRSCLQ